jgi:hypothetical protein
MVLYSVGLYFYRKLPTGILLSVRLYEGGWSLAPELVSRGLLIERRPNLGGISPFLLSGVSTFRISPDDQYRLVKSISLRVETLLKVRSRGGCGTLETPGGFGAGRRSRRQSNPQERSAVQGS